MNIEELEQIALKSHNGQLEFSDEKPNPFNGIARLEERLGINVKQRRDQIRRHYPNEPIIAAELGCFNATVVAEMQYIGGIEAFGIDKKPYLNRLLELPARRLIVADLNCMPQIPDNTFHYMLSFNTLSYTDITKSFPEIFRVLKPGGVADLDLEFWPEYIGRLEQSLLYPQLMVASTRSDYRAKVEEFFRDIEKVKEESPELVGFFCYSTRLEMAKPI